MTATTENSGQPAEESPGNETHERSQSSDDDNEDTRSHWVSFSLNLSCALMYGYAIYFQNCKYHKVATP